MISVWIPCQLNNIGWKLYSNSRDFWIVIRVICASDSESTESVSGPVVWFIPQPCELSSHIAENGSDEDWKQMPRAFPSTALLNANLSCSVHSTLTPFREDSKNFTVFFPIFFFLLCCSLETPDQRWGIFKSSCNFFSLRSHRPERLSIQCHKTVKYNLLLN